MMDVEGERHALIAGIGDEIDGVVQAMVAVPLVL